MREVKKQLLEDKLFNSQSSVVPLHDNTSWVLVSAVPLIYYSCIWVVKRLNLKKNCQNIFQYNLKFKRSRREALRDRFCNNWNLKKKKHKVKLERKNQAIWSYFSEISIKCLKIYVRSEFYEAFWKMEKILFENILKILEQFWISCKITKKILKGRGCNFRKILQKFSENFEKIFKYKKCWNNVNVKKILLTHIQKNFKTFLWNFQKIVKKFSDIRKILKTFYKHFSQIF